MSDYIERQAVIDAIHEEFDDCVVWDESGERTADEVESIIDRVPSADVVQVRHGKWTHKPDVHGVVYCSECDYELHINATSFCPKCGAKMDARREG